MDIVIKFLVVAAQISAICMVGAWIADRIIEPKVRTPPR